MLFLCFSTDINFRHLFKKSAFGTYAMHVLSRECHLSMDASIVRCSMLCQTFFLVTERNE